MSDDSSILILGAGPTGLGAAWRLRALGHTNWRMVEAAQEPGGLAGSVRDPQGFTWDFGGHVLFSHYPVFDQAVEEALQGRWLTHQRNAFVWMRERFIPYPLQNNFWMLPGRESWRIWKGLWEAKKQRFGSSATFEAWILSRFGKGLADAFLLPYNRKVWASPPSELNAEWTGERVSLPSMSRLMIHALLRRPDRQWGPNAAFRFPLLGGTGSIWKEMAKRLDPARIRFGQRVTRVSAARRTVTLAAGEELRYDRLLSTLPLDDLLRMMDDQPELSAKAGRFRHSSVNVVGIGLEGTPPKALTDKTWIYFPEPEMPFYRVTVFSNYSPNNVLRPGSQWSLMAEIAVPPSAPRDDQGMIERTLAAFKQLGWVTERSAVASRFHWYIHHAYPTPFLGRDTLLGEIHPALRSLDIRSRGRFGGWKYEVSNMDHCFMQGAEAVDAWLTGKEETTYV